VIHERYPRHGPAFYQERERLARERMAVLHPDSEAAFALTDDIAVGLDRRGRTDEAIALMRDKLKRQQALDLKGKDLYSSYANLAEFLIRGNRWRMMGGDAAAREHVREGREFLRKSITVNPDAHFGREEWQAVAIDGWLEFGTRPDLLRKTDLIGNRLDVSIEISREVDWFDLVADTQAASRRPYLYGWVETIYVGQGRLATNYEKLEPSRRAELRQYVASVGEENAPGKASGTKRGKRAAFDEPALWLIGEWRQGSGPNPHFALCLGEIMLRVGQRYLAWTCYERASRVAEHFWPTPELQQFLREHCQRRQAAIERSLPAAEVAGLRPKFESELAFGEAYQRDYQAYEQEKIQAGADLNDAHFFDEYFASRPPIASKVGPEEWYAGTTGPGRMTAQLRAFCEWGMLTGGAVVLLLAVVFLLVCKPGDRLRVEVIRQP
ncbi:MAG: hypothetical protein J2P46_17480, partial [Zavarzinella sp.]|nr:hypothetical protein [Zavarzinella sp.]